MYTRKVDISTSNLHFPLGILSWSWQQVPLPNLSLKNNCTPIPATSVYMDIGPPTETQAITSATAPEKDDSS